MLTFLKKITLGVAILIGLAGYMGWTSTQASASTAAIATNNTVVANAAATVTTATAASSASIGSSVSNTATSNTASNSSGSSGTIASSGGSTASAGQFKNGTYTGSAASTEYGAVQVEAIITNGALTDVKFLSYPSGASHSGQVSAGAMPILVQEAISSQSAYVSGVSGATQISSAFQQSLDSALSQAQA